MKVSWTGSIGLNKLMSLDLVGYCWQVSNGLEVTQTI